MVMDSEKKDLFDLVEKRIAFQRNVDHLEGEVKDLLFGVLDVDDSYELNIDFKADAGDLEFQLVLGKWLDTADFKRLFDAGKKIGFVVTSIWAEENQIKLYFSMREDEQ